MADHSHLRIETSEQGVRTITLDRAEKLNAVNSALADALGSALEEAAREDAVRVVVITGAGRAFCAGLDISAPPEIPSSTLAERLDPYAWVGRWVQRVVACEKPVIAAVNGAAAGAGFGLALACDVRVIAASATMTAGYVRRGLSPDAGVSWFLPRHVGLARAADILLTGRDVGAEEAERIGLVAMVAPDEQFASAASSYATRLAAGAPVAHALTKRLLLHALEQPLEAHLREELVHIKYSFTTADVREAMSAFREKRRPSFGGK
jgi:2-(1,2-epoxy-1,2-dihydrophenyl)acetyl-CoA isomerase